MPTFSGSGYSWAGPASWAAEARPRPVRKQGGLAGSPLLWSPVSASVDTVTGHAGVVLPETVTGAARLDMSSGELSHLISYAGHRRDSEYSQGSEKLTTLRPWSRSASQQRADSKCVKWRFHQEKTVQGVGCGIRFLEKSYCPDWRVNEDKRGKSQRVVDSVKREWCEDRTPVAFYGSEVWTLVQLLHSYWWCFTNWVNQTRQLAELRSQHFLWEGHTLPAKSLNS